MMIQGMQQRCLCIHAGPFSTFLDVLALILFYFFSFARESCILNYTCINLNELCVAKKSLKERQSLLVFTVIIT